MKTGVREVDDASPDRSEGQPSPPPGEVGALSLDAGIGNGREVGCSTETVSHGAPIPVTRRASAISVMIDKAAATMGGSAEAGRDRLSRIARSAISQCR